MRVMGVKGLTLYHLKSHLQKFRLGKQPHKEFNDHSIKDGMRASALDQFQRNTASSSGMISCNMNKVQIEVQRRLQEQLEVQRHLQLRIEAQGKYMQSILEKACQTLAGENNNNMASGSYKGTIVNNHGTSVGLSPQSHHDHINGAMIKDFTSPLGFQSFQDLNIYGGDHLDLQQAMDRPSAVDGFLSDSDGGGICLGKKRPSPYGGGGSGKSPLIWSDVDLRLQDSASCLGPQDVPFKGDHQIERSGGAEIDSLSELYESKPVISGDHMGEKKFHEAAGGLKLERPSPRRAPLNGADQRIMSPMIQGRNSPFG